MNRDILTVIQENMSTFSKGQKRIANYILESYDKAAFMTASRLGKTVSVSESTVVRFAAELGYDGYPSMQRSLQKMLRTRLTSVQRIEVSNDRIGDQDLLSSVLQSDIEKLRLTLEEVDRQSFDRAVDAIVSARKIYIMGVRSSASLATFLSFYFNLIFDNVISVAANTASEVFETMLRVGAEDVVIGVSFPRYSSRTVQAMSFARDRKATTVAITDSEAAPLAPICKYTLKARSDMASFVDSLVAPLSLINSLLVAIARSKSDVVDHFERLEHIWEEYGVFVSMEEENQCRRPLWWWRAAARRVCSPRCGSPNRAPRRSSRRRRPSWAASSGAGMCSSRRSLRPGRCSPSCGGGWRRAACGWRRAPKWWAYRPARCGSPTDGPMRATRRFSARVSRSSTPRSRRSTATASTTTC